MTERVTWVSTNIERGNGWYIVDYAITDSTGKYFKHIKCDTKTGATQTVRELKREIKKGAKNV